MLEPRKSVLYFKSKEIPDHLSCTICLEVFVDPQKISCSHSFCKSCLKGWMRSGKECPVCRKKITKVEDATKVQKEIDSLSVMCRFINCAWIGSKSSIDLHENECVFSPLKTEKKVLELLPEYEKGEDNETPTIWLVTKLFEMDPKLTEKILRIDKVKKSGESKIVHDTGLPFKQKKIDDFLNGDN